MRGKGSFFMLWAADGARDCTICWWAEQRSFQQGKVRIFQVKTGCTQLILYSERAPWTVPPLQGPEAHLSTGLRFLSQETSSASARIFTTGCLDTKVALPAPGRGAPAAFTALYWCPWAPLTLCHHWARTHTRHTAKAHLFAPRQASKQVSTGNYMEEFTRGFHTLPFEQAQGQQVIG